MADLSDGYVALGADVDKVAATNGNDTTEGVSSDYMGELELPMSNEELIELSRDWEKNWSEANTQLVKVQQDNEDYWLGKQFTESNLDKHPLIDNLVFEGLETFLPIATRPSADPLVESDQTEAGIALSDTVRKMLNYQAGPSRLSFNIKLKSVARHWSLYHLGAMKFGWSMVEDDITCVVVRPQKLILDPMATIIDAEYNGEYIGEYIETTARKLILRFPTSKEYITELVRDRLGTKIKYIEWWTDDAVFWKLNDHILGKSKNPHWNYEKQVPGPMDDMGNPGQPTIQKPNNHFKQSKKPYIFLSIFNLGMHPYDDTSIISQVLPLQDLINTRLRQINKNANNTNGGLIVSGSSFTKEQAAGVSDALAKGGTIWVPTGDVNTAVRRDTGAPLPKFVYESLIDYRNELRNIFGTRGSTPDGTQREQTVRGKLIIQGQDTSRIGGGISTFLEQFSSKAFNWFTQLMYVYYDEPHAAAVMGQERAMQYIQIQSQDFVTKLSVSVKDGSMIPKDPVTLRNEAIDLWGAGALDPITLFDRLEFPNPRESAENLFKWKSDPISLFPDLASQQQPQQTEKPGESINYKDLPPEGQAQMAAQAGIQLNPQAIMAHNDQQQQKKQQEMALKMQQRGPTADSSSPSNQPLG